MKNKSLAIMCVAVLAVLPSCSSSSSGNSTLNGIEQDVSALMEVMATVIGTLDPFAVPAPVAKTSMTGIPTCTDVSEGICNGGGSVEECPPVGGDIDVNFLNCTIDIPAIPGQVPEPFTISIDGTLTYSPLEVWPSGTRDLIITTMDESWSYDVTFDHSPISQIDVLDLIEGTVADCLGSLETFVADCELIENAF